MAWSFLNGKVFHHGLSFFSAHVRYLGFLFNFVSVGSL